MKSSRAILTRVKGGGSIHLFHDFLPLSTPFSHSAGNAVGERERRRERLVSWRGGVGVGEPEGREREGEEEEEEIGEKGDRIGGRGPGSRGWDSGGSGRDFWILGLFLEGLR